MRRDLIYAVVLWLVLTTIGEVWASNTTYFPMIAAEQAKTVDEAFRMLLLLAVPVATLVLTFLGYSFVRFRSQDTEDGPPIRSNRLISVSWFVVTSALAALVIINPGLSGLNELDVLSADTSSQFVIQVEGEQWHWNVTYPDYDLSYQRALQIAVPVHTPVRVELTSKDVLHAFWIPAFGVKMDAVPGRTTMLYFTATELGTFEDDPNMRVQCAELCGTGHARMQMAVQVLEQEDFERWIAEAHEFTESDGMDMGGMDMDMSGEDTDNMDMDMGDETTNDMNMDMNAEATDDMDMDMDDESTDDMDMDMGDETTNDMDMDMDDESTNDMDMDMNAETTESPVDADSD